MIAVSVAMATYNGEAHIREQLESLAAQTQLPSELVVTDDQSTDATIEILETFAKGAPFPVRIVRNDVRLGFGDNFLKAAALCEAPLIAFCDQDDRWLPHKLSVCAAPFQDPDVFVSVHTSQLWYGGDAVGGFVPHFKQRQILPAAGADPLNNYLGFSNIFRREVLQIADNAVRPRHPNIVKGVGTTPHAMVHDQWIWFLGSIFGKVAFIPEVQCLYRQHSNNTVGFSFRKATVRERLNLDKAAWFAQGEAVASECAAFIEQLGARLPRGMQTLALTAATGMRSRAHICRLRKQIYLNETPLRSRLLSHLTLLRRGGYRQPSSSRYAFGHKAFIKDLLVGVPATQTLLRGH